MPGKFLTIDEELTIHYEESGSGNLSLLLVPGWTMSTKVFEHQLRFFSASETYRCLSLDPRAHGLSSKTEGGHFYELHGRDLHQFIESLDLKNLVLCGWSFGTLATLSYVNQFGSDRLSGFIMLDGPPRATGEDNRLDWVTYSYEDGDKSQEFFTMGRLRDRDVTNVEFAKWMLEYKTEENIEWVLNITNQTPDSAAALLNATSNFLDYREDLIALTHKMPVLYIVRKKQENTVTRWADQHTPSALMSAFGEHMMFWERPDEFNEILIKFLDHCKQRNNP